MNEVRDGRLAAACRIVWNPDAWKDPGHGYMVAKMLQEMLQEEDLNQEDRAEAEYLLPKVYASMKRPCVY